MRRLILFPKIALSAAAALLLLARGADRSPADTPPAPGKHPVSAPAVPSDLRPLPARLGPPYTHPFAGFTLRKPRDWEEGKPAEGATASLYGPKDRFYLPRMDVFHHATSGDVSAFADTYRVSFRKAYPGARFEAERVFPLGAERDAPSAVQFVAVIPQEGAIEARALVTVTVRDGHGFAVLFLTQGGYFERYRALVARSMESFRFRPVPALSEEARGKFNDRYREGYDAVQRGDHDAAIAAFRAAAEILPDFPDLHRYLGGLLAENGDDAAAVVSYRRALELDPDHPEALYNLGTLELREERLADAERHLGRAAELDPENDRALINLGVLYAGRGDADRARKSIERALEINPESANAHYQLGQVLETSGRKEEALRHYRDALSLKPDHAGAREAAERLQK